MKEIFEVRTTDFKPKVTTYFAGCGILGKKEFFLRLSWYSLKYKFKIANSF